MEEYVIFIGLAFFLVYLSTTYENNWLKLSLKFFGTYLSILAAYIPLVEVSLAERAGLYDLFAFSFMWGMCLFYFIWFIVLLYEMFQFFIDKKKRDLEETQ